MSKKCKTLEQAILEQAPAVKVNKSELNWYSNDCKTPEKHVWKSPTRMSYKL